MAAIDDSGIVDLLNSSDEESDSEDSGELSS
jgi:hypothetical protein